MLYRLVPISAIALLLLATAGTAGPDKVTFPTGYKTNHVLYTTVDRPDNKTVRDIYASREAVKTAKASQPLPSGTVITMEVYKAEWMTRGAREGRERSLPQRRSDGDLCDGEAHRLGC